VDRVAGLDDVRADIAMMRTPDGHGGLELTRYHRPAAIGAESASSSANTLGLRNIMFAVDDLEDVLDRLGPHGAEFVGEVARYEDSYLLCYVRGRPASSSPSPSNSAEPPRPRGASEPGQDQKRHI